MDTLTVALIVHVSRSLNDEHVLQKTNAKRLYKPLPWL